MAALPNLTDWLQKQAFGLALSSCYFGFFAHVGALSALEEHRLIPSKISGASAGALAGTMWASGNSTASLHRILLQLERSAFWDPGIVPGLLKGDKFRALVAEITGIKQLENCSIPLALSAFDCFSMRTHSLRTGNLANAVYASCAVPLLFHPLKIGKAYYIDGGIRDWAGTAGLMTDSRILQIGLYNKPYRHSNTKPDFKLLVTDQGIELQLRNLTTVSPFSMHLGKIAFQEARTAMLQALRQPIRAS